MVEIHNKVDNDMMDGFRGVPTPTEPSQDIFVLVSVFTHLALVSATAEQ